jgi:hypothetical protein
MKARVSKTLSGEEVEWKVDCATAVEWVLCCRWRCGCRVDRETGMLQ